MISEFPFARGKKVSLSSCIINSLEIWDERQKIIKELKVALNIPLPPWLALQEVALYFLFSSKTVPPPPPPYPARDWS